MREPFTETEITKATGSLKNGKIIGPDNMHAGLIKYAPPEKVAETGKTITEREQELLGEDIFSILLSSSVMLSIVNLFVITVDRFLAVKYPLKHHVRSSVVNTNAIIGMIWLLEVGKSIALLYLSVKQKIEEQVLLYSTAVSIIAFGLFMTVVYMYIVHRSCARRTMLNSQGATHGQIVNSFFCEDFKKERHIFYTCCLINFTFIICSYPFAIQYLVTVSADPEEYTISRLMLFLNSTLNPLVYFFKGYLERRKTDNSVAVVQRH
eukprot:gene3425-1794_t